MAWLPEAEADGSYRIMYFRWPPFEAELSISKFYFLFKRGRKLLFLIYSLILIVDARNILPHDYQGN
jgi:hypothetical protein